MSSKNVIPTTPKNPGSLKEDGSNPRPTSPPPPPPPPPPKKN